MVEQAPVMSNSFTDSEVQLAIARRIQAQGLQNIDLTIPVQRALANTVRSEMKLPPLPESFKDKIDTSARHLAVTAVQGVVNG